MSSMSELLRLRWDRHRDALCGNTAAFLFDDMFSDVSLCSSEGTRVPAHRFALMCGSNYFKTIFRQIQRDPTSVIILKDVTDYVIRRIVEFIYIGTTNVHRDHLHDFMDAGRVLQIEGLMGSEPEKKSHSPIKVDDEDIQGQELDLSQNGPSRQNSQPPPPPTPTFQESREHMVPKLIAAPQAHLNHALMNSTAAFGNAFENPFLHSAALAMRSNPQSYLNAQLNSPSRPSLPNQPLPRQSPHKSISISPKMQVEDDYARRDAAAAAAAAAASILRFSKSPEDNSNASLDLTKGSNANSPLNRLNAVNQSLNLVSGAQTLSNSANINAALASQIQQMSRHFKPPPIRVSQNVLKRSRSRSPEIVDVGSANDLHERNENNSSPCPDQANHDQSPHNGKPNSSGGSSSSDPNNYSDDDSGAENRDQERDEELRSVSPGPSTSTPKIIDGLVSQNTGYGGLPWAYPEGVSRQIGDDNGGTAGFWKNSFKNSLLAPYLNTSLPSLSPGSATTLSPTFPGLYPPTSLSSPWACNSSSPPSLHSIPFLRSNECARCGRLYKTRKGLKHHMKNECGVEPRFQCTRCDWKFKQKAHLLRHISRKHSPVESGIQQTNAGTLQA